MKEKQMTKVGHKNLEKELDELKNKKRLEVAERLKQALSFGDLSENAEYEEARAEQSFVEGRIQEIETLLRYAIVVDESEVDTTSVKIGTKVRLFFYDENTEVEYSIVGSHESKADENKISNESPVGKALLNRIKDEDIEIEVPAGKHKYKILEINKLG